MILRNGHIFFVVSIIVLTLPKVLIFIYLFIFYFASNLVVILVMTFDITGLDLCQERKVWRDKTSQRASST